MCHWLLDNWKCTKMKHVGGNDHTFKLRFLLKQTMYIVSPRNFTINTYIKMINTYICFYSLQGPTHIKRATTEKLRDVFHRYASQEIRGERYMTSEDFVRRYLGLFPETSYNKVSIILWILRKYYKFVWPVWRSMTCFTQYIAIYSH